MEEQFTSTEAALTMASHRLLSLSGEDVAVISDQSTGWCVVQKSEYDTIASYLSSCKRTLQDVDERTGQVLRTLWDSGLLLADGNPHSGTNYKQSLYPNAILLKLTGACDLECAYCYDYDGERFKARLDLERIKEVISFLLSKQPFLSVVFHGGEPLLRFELIKEVVEYTLEEAGTSAKVGFSIQTNGLRFNEEVISFFEKYNFSIGISLDGADEESNRLRKVHRGTTPLKAVKELYSKYPEFVKNRCGFLAVVSKISAPHLPEFALWLQERGINGLSISFLDLVGRGKSLRSEMLTPYEAVQVYRSFVEMIRRGEIQELSINNLISRISNLFNFQPKDLCQKGPCGAAGDFLVLDAEGKLRTCDCVYNSFFEIGNDKMQVPENISTTGRRAVIERHAWLRENGADCSSCALFGVCGGTCVAKAIAKNKEPKSVDSIECAISQYLYPELLNEFAANKEMPLFDYYSLHKKQRKGV